MTCNYNKLAKFIEGHLDLNDKLEILFHLENCTACFDEVYKLRKMQDEKYFVKKKFNLEKMVS